MTPKKNKLLQPATWMIGLIAAVYGLSIVYQLKTKRELAPEGTKVIRISHSRLEPGYAEALNAVIADFVELKRRQGEKVAVQHSAISAGVYEPWLNTQLVGDIAPDIVEQPESKYQMAGVYYTTYFEMLDELSAHPNPYNDFNEIASTLGDLDLNRNVPQRVKAAYPELQQPLTVQDAVDQIEPSMREILRKQGHRETYTDGMIGGFNFSAAHYYRYTVSASQRRILYNKSIIRQATGKEDPPTGLQDFIDMCERIKSINTESGKPIIPIAATKDTPRSVFHDVYFVPFTWALSYRINDHLLYGIAKGHFEGYMAESWSLQSPEIRAFYELAETLSSYMTPGYQSLDRASSTFDFVQGRAAMRVTDVEEASGLFMQADFPIGVMDFPMPQPGERWYEYAPYPMREYNRASGQFSLSKQSEHPKLALEFMQFWTSRIWNERFNRFAELVPVIKSAEPSENLEPFLVRDTGVLGIPQSLELGRGGFPAHIAQRGEEWRFLSGETDYDTYAEHVDAIYRDPEVGANRVFSLKWDNEWRLAKRADQGIAIPAAQALLLPPEGGIDRDAYNYTLFRTAIYSNGTLHRFSFDRDQYGKPEMESFPEF